MPDHTQIVLLVAGIAALASVVGGLISLWHKPTTFFVSLALGFASGVLISAVTFEMIPRALEISALRTVVLGFISGVAAIYAFDLYVHRGVMAGERADQRRTVDMFYRRRRPAGSPVTVLAVGTSAEEVVEGLSIGVGAAIDPGLALLIATSIAINNLSEGLSIGELIRAEPERRTGEHVRRVLGWTGVIGGTLLISAMLGWFLLQGLNPALLAFLLAMGGGAMLYLTVTDLVPEAQVRHYQQSSALATAAGFLVILVLSAFV